VSNLTVARAASTRREEPEKKSRFRPDIQGLRTVAVLAVLVYHLNSAWLPGGFVGVDIFFVISGFLITGILLRQLESTGRISIREFYGRRAKRLIPAATLVLLATLGLSFLILPPTRWESIGWDGIASAFYVENWRLAQTSVDYLSLDAAPSPLQHFWSLGVEEQFYLVWPFLLVLVGLFFASRHHHRSRSRRITSPRFRPAVLAALAVVTVPSLLWSIYYTSESAGPAYFVTTTRMWELAIGAIVAAAAVYIARLNRAVLIVAGWAGIVGIIASLTLIGPGVPYPGAAALLPTVATALVLAGGIVPARYGPGIVLGIRPAVFVGDISYSLYLWHWPLIVLATSILGEINLLAAAVLAALSIGLAWATYRWVENPFNTAKVLTDEPSKAIALGLCLMIVTGLAGGALIFAFRDAQNAARASSYVAPEATAGLDGEPAQIEQGALLLPNPPAGTEPVATSEIITPAAINAAADWPSCPTSAVDSSEVKSCSIGPEDGTRVALVGDSHAKQWIPAFQTVAAERNWRVTVYIHDACPFALGELVRQGAPYESCMAWNEAMQGVLANDSALAMVFTSNYTDAAAVSGSRGVAGMAEAHAAAWKPLLDRGTPVVAIRDTPAPKIDVPECVSQNESNLLACAVPREQASDNRGLALVEATQRESRAALVDLNEYICPGASCAPVIGNVLVYRDLSHITATYAKSLGPILNERLTSVVPGS
jgi:peptidoglycan/LPS O-acetylase OafA/YrhL